MTERAAVSLYLQTEAVLESARRANSALTDAMIIWHEGDWRVQQTKKRMEHLTAAYETLKGLLDAELARAPEQSARDAEKSAREDGK